MASGPTAFQDAALAFEDDAFQIGAAVGASLMPYTVVWTRKKKKPVLATPFPDQAIKVRHMRAEEVVAALLQKGWL